MKQREAANGGIPHKSVSICLCVFLLPLHPQRLLLPQVADDQQARRGIPSAQEFEAVCGSETLLILELGSLYSLYHTPLLIGMDRPSSA